MSRELAAVIVTILAVAVAISVAAYALNPWDYSYGPRSQVQGMGRGMMSSAMGPSSTQGGPGWGGMMNGGMGGMMGGGMGGMMGDAGRGHCWNAGGGNTTSTWVVISNNNFYPQTLRVKAGATVTWTNMDQVDHSVKSGTPQAPTSQFSSGLLNHMQSFSYTFTQPGTYTYYCEPHPNMIGTVIVE